MPMQNVVTGAAAGSSPKAVERHIELLANPVQQSNVDGSLAAILSIDLAKYILHELLELPGISGTLELSGRLHSLTGSFGVFVITDDRCPLAYSRKSPDWCSAQCRVSRYSLEDVVIVHV
jgi:hypothetical protein